MVRCWNGQNGWQVPCAACRCCPVLLLRVRLGAGHGCSFFVPAPFGTHPLPKGKCTMALYTVHDADFSVCCCKSRPHARSILVTSSRDCTVREMACANLVGCRGQREQSMGGAPPGSSIEPSQGIAGLFGASKIPAPLCCFLLLLLLCLAVWQRSPRGFCVSHYRQSMSRPNSLNFQPTCRAQEARTERHFLRAISQIRGGSHMQGPSHTKFIPRLFPVILFPPRAPRGERPGSRHKLIMDGSAPTLSNHVRLLLPCNRAGLHFWPPLVLCVTMLNEAMICHNFSSLSSSPVKPSPRLLPSDYCFQWRKYSRPCSPYTVPVFLGDVCIESFLLMIQ